MTDEELDSLEDMLKSSNIEDVELAIAIIESLPDKPADISTQGIMALINRCRYHHNTWLSPYEKNKGLWKQLPSKYGKQISERLTRLLRTKYGIR